MLLLLIELLVIVVQQRMLVLFDMLCWNSKLAPRAYAAVHENRIETNHPFTFCCGLIVCDNVRVLYFDIHSPNTHWAHAPSCTPFHLCCFVEIAGGVSAIAPMDCCNNCCCTSYRYFVPGLPDAAQFTSVANQTRQAFFAGQRLQAVQLVAVTQAPVTMVMQ